MKIIGVIPARYQSSRFPGKPLADICGRPMIWWVYQQVKKVKGFADVFVAIDDIRIEAVCEEYNIKFVLTSDKHPNHISRLHEVSEKIKSDYYICVNGDEPLIDPESISKIFPLKKNKGFYFCGAMRRLTDPVEAIDISNIKLVVSSNGHCMYMSRVPIPFPKGTLFFHYNKYVGIECFTKEALDFFVATPMGENEKAEDIDHLRFLENEKSIFFIPIETESISVDTPKDLEKVHSIVQRKIDRGEILFPI